MIGSSAIRLARAYLAAVAEPPAPALATFVEELGPIDAAAQVRRGEVPEPVAKETSARREWDRGAAHLRAAEAIGARLLIPEDEDWPTAPFLSFAMCGHAHLATPLALWARGPARLVELTERSVAIVGARAATMYGKHVANSIGFGVAELGCTVVSGAAYGIDGAAHRGALAAGGRTVAFLAGGLDAPYPLGHTTLFRRMVETGVLVSEWPVGTVPQRHRFLSRNRLIAAVSAGTVVVEAAGRSGTSKTAKDAGELGRALMAVPGPITSAMSVGTHELIRKENAQLVTRLEDVLEAVGRIGDDLAPRLKADTTARDRLDPLARQVLDAFPARRAASPEQIALEAAVSLPDVLRMLPSLEIDGFVARRDDGWRLCPGGGAKRR